jgi:hypothetical protein
LHCYYKKKKGGSEKAVMRLRPELTKQGPSGVIVEGLVTLRAAWKKYSHKAPSKSSTEASGAFLEEVLLVCKNQS